MAGSDAAEVRHFFNQLAFKIKISRQTQRQLDVYLATGMNIVRDYVRPDENRISDIFADLLNPHGPHGQGTIFLGEFLKVLKLPDMIVDADSAILREYYTDKGRKIDVVLTFADGKAIGIENKPFAEDQPNQLEDYCAYLQRRFSGNYVLFYLTPGGANPSAFSISVEMLDQLKTAGNLRCISYRVEIRTWLENCIKECRAEKVRWFLRDLIDYVGSPLFVSQMSREDESDAE